LETRHRCIAKGGKWGLLAREILLVCLQNNDRAARRDDGESGFAWRGRGADGRVVERKCRCIRRRLRVDRRQQWAHSAPLRLPTSHRGSPSRGAVASPLRGFRTATPGTRGSASFTIGAEGPRAGAPDLFVPGGVRNVKHRVGSHRGDRSQ